MLGGRCFCLMFHSLSAINGKQALKVVTVGTETSESVLIKQALDAAAGAHLVGTTLGTNGPAHAAVPAAAQDHGRPGKAGCHQSHGPQPLETPGFRGRRRLLGLCFHCHTTWGTNLPVRISPFVEVGNGEVVQPSIRFSATGRLWLNGRDG